MLNRKNMGKISTAVILASVLLIGCKNVLPSESSSLLESSVSSSENSSESVSSTLSEAPPAEDKGAEVLSKMRLLSGRISEYKGAAQKLANPLTESGKKIEAELEQARSLLEDAEKAAYKDAEIAIQTAGEHLTAALEAQAQFLTDTFDVPKQMDDLLEKLDELQMQAVDLLDTSEEKKESLNLLKEFIDKESEHIKAAKDQIDQMLEVIQKLSEESPQIAVKMEQILTAKKAEQEAAQKMEEQAKASSSSVPDSASSAPEKAEPQENPENSFPKVVVKKAGSTDSETSSSAKSRFSRKTAAEDGILEELNAYRRSLGIEEVTRESGLDDCSAIRVVEMLDNDIFSHTRPNGTSWETVLSENNIKPLAWGEIQYRRRGTLAVGDQSVMVSQCMDGWKTSKGHDAIMRDSTYTKVGIALYASGSETWIANIIFIK